MIFKDIVKANYDNQTIENKEYENIKFINCSFVETEIKKCKFVSCKLINCKIVAVKLTDSIMIETSLKDSKAEGIDWTKAGEIRELSFENCILNYSNFSMLKLSNIKIINCEAKECVFTETVLVKADFTGTDFEGTRFFKTNLSDADFKNAKNYWIDIRECNIKAAKFNLPAALNLLTASGVHLND